MTTNASLVRELRKRAAARTPTPQEQTEHCDLCGVEIPPDHRHLLHLEERRIACSCEACRALLQGDSPWRPTGTRTLWLNDLVFSDEVWGRFGIPIGLAFFLTRASGGVVALYPSPAGATESELDLDAWAELVSANPGLQNLEPEIEGLIVNRLSEPQQYAVAPVDECYRLVGLIKTAWQGISGGPSVGAAVESFFSELETRAVS
ncbi:MAG: hypothetical protein QOF27_2534 [Gaiellaceae bacterium]|jgi:hypothetical protein|nr:hypothetical protein [Gaiellaceae bacterium]